MLGSTTENYCISAHVEDPSKPKLNNTLTVLFLIELLKHGFLTSENVVSNKHFHLFHPPLFHHFQHVAMIQVTG
jgi:hypothetical protein